MKRLLCGVAILVALGACTHTALEEPAQVPAPSASIQGGKPKGDEVYRGMFEYMIELKMRELMAPALAPRTRPQTI